MTAHAPRAAAPVVVGSAPLDGQVAPLWAGLIARLNQGLGKPVGYLYGLGKSRWYRAA
jgi:hypothetical protein